MSSVFEERIKTKIEQNISGATPGALVQVYQNGKKICDVAVGDTYAYYDLASLTKVIFTTQMMMKLFQEGKWNLQTQVKNIVPWFPVESTRIADLLNHSSGLYWWKPFYKDLSLDLPVADRWKKVSEMIATSPYEAREESVYSDLGFLTLAFVIQELSGKTLAENWKDLKEQFYPHLSLEFHENNQPKFQRKLYAPTEKCVWRGRVLQGEVHDENCWALGGLSTHAGLFGSVDDVGWFGLFVRSQLQGISRTIIKQKTAQLFAQRSRPIGKGDWALGYMMPTRGGSSSGDYFSPYSIGHTGFTGTSFWYDPAQDLVVVIISNRVAFGREIEDFKKLRPQIHNWIVEGLRRS